MLLIYLLLGLLVPTLCQGKEFRVTDLLEDVVILDNKSEREMSMIEMVRFHGYPVEHVYTTTPDGHILDLYHITGPRGSSLDVKGAQKKRPVLLVHGIL
jgi:lysosomal acid lipase/cholesteryl ester hydrolase